jgi:nucleoside-diphosphate-sugar epimerase
VIVAVTGSSGFLGNKLVDSLLERGHQVISIDISNGIDIMEWEKFKNIEYFDVLVHLAAMSFVPLSYEKPREFYSLNINGVINGLELCRIYGAKFIFASSYVYGNPRYLPIDEDHPVEGFNPYAETKLIGEHICENYFKYFKVRSIILRPFNIYGLGQNGQYLIPIILEQAKTGAIKLLDPHPKRDFVYVDDVVNAFRIAVENNDVKHDRFNVGYGVSHSVNDVVEVVNKLYDNSLKVEYDNEQRKNEVLDTIADISKIKSSLNWTPETSLFKGLRRMIR